MNIATTIDTLLDRTIAPGYGSVGLELRRRLPGWPADPPRMDGKVALVTGAASGIGLATAIGFARLGASVRAVARTEARASDAVAQIEEAVPGAEATPVAADVSSLAQIRGLAERLSAEEEHLDVLVNNAGAMPEQRQHSAEGHELMFATHVLGPFALTILLGELLRRSAPARVINVSSGGMYTQRLPADDLESERTPYNSTKLYARTKREQVVITEMLAERLHSAGVYVHAMHPGWVDTHGVQQWLPRFRAITRPIIRTPEQGADTIVWLGGAPDAVSGNGRFWQDRRPRPTHYRLGASASTPQERRRLWDHCERALEASGTAPATQAV
jgi:dehydrogenase/reductase SDR family protein 12